MLAHLAAPAAIQALQTPAPAARDTVYRWFVGAYHEHESLRSDLPQWTDWTTTRFEVSREVSNGTLGVEGFRVARFGSADVGGAVEGYRTLWDGAYGHVRLRVTPDARVLPRADGRIEVFQSLPGGWEASGSYWRMDYAADDVGIVGAGVAKYVGNWYLRQATFLSTLAGTSVVSVSASARRFLDPPREFVEIAAGVGREAVVLGPGPTIETRDTRFLQLRAQRFVAGRWGLAGGVSYHGFEGAPERVGFSLGLIGRH